MNDYPKGKIAPDDEGESALAITVVNNRLLINFPKPMRWIGFDLRRAKELE